MNPGTYGEDGFRTEITVNNDGVISDIVNVIAPREAPDLESTTGTIEIVDDGPAANINLSATAVSAGSYGSLSQFTNFTVDEYGRVTAALTTPVDDATKSVYLGPNVCTIPFASQNSVIIGNTAGTQTDDGFISRSVVVGNSTAGHASNAGVSRSVIVGQGAAENITGFANGYNTLVGYSSGVNMTGQHNTIMGAQSGMSQTGDNNVIIGDSAGEFCQGDNVAIGASAAHQQASGAIGIGSNIGWSNAGSDVQPATSVAIGYRCTYPGAAGRLAFGNSMEAIQTTATIGAHGAPPAQVAGYIRLEWNDQLVKIPFYND